MVDLTQKARDGRTNALAGLSVNFRKTILGNEKRIEFRPDRYPNPIAFVSRRANPQAAWVH